VLERIGARRVLLIAALAVAVLVGTVAATNLQSQAVYYLTPTEAQGRALAPGQTVRLGGQVMPGTLVSDANGVRFVLTDGVNTVFVTGSGPIPGLLREGAGAVVEGWFLPNGTFNATQVIAKHDEVYTAPRAGATPPHKTSQP
jgi:cytochrome c-type biogenesis protein CcmE